MKLSLFLLNVLLLTLMLACDSASNFEGGISSATAYTPTGSEATEAKLVSNASVTTERKLIRNGRLELLTSDVEKMRGDVEGLCKKYNAYIASENRDNYNRRVQYDQQIRIPASQFDAFLKEVETLGEHTDSRSISTQDVTEQFIDLEARLKTKKALEARYLTLLAQAKTVADILAIESQVANARAEIESMQGRLNYLTNQVSFSTLSLVYYERTSNEFGFGSRSIASLESGWQNLLWFLLGLLNVWPFVIVGVGITWLIVRRRRVKRMQRQAAIL